MHQPLRPATYDEAGAKREQVRVRDALIAGNSPDDVRADWIDYEAAGVADAAALTEAALDRAAARRDGARGHRLRPRERVGPAGPPVHRGDGPRGARAHPGPGAGRGPRVVRRALRPDALPLEHQRRGEPAVRHAEERLVPAGEPAGQSGVRRAAARRRAAGRSLRGGRQGGGHHGRAVRRRRPRQRSLRPVQLHQRGRPAGVPRAAREDRGRDARRDLGRGEGASARHHLPARRGPASAGRDRRGNAAQGGRGPRRVSPPLHRSRRPRRVLRARPLQFRRCRSRTTSCSAASRSSRRTRRAGSTRWCARSRAKSA